MLSIIISILLPYYNHSSISYAHSNIISLMSSTAVMIVSIVIAYAIINHSTILISIISS